jgi:hypothetical protein
VLARYAYTYDPGGELDERADRQRGDARSFTHVIRGEVANSEPLA